ncbi:MAG TPA: thiamine ABC transporter substrate-binding protein, partial [Candidatus Acetothermia bacterium]|nr:thiamine ABC transporter substrate-binding protein [Candidatus Acetothermia bacterium]
VEYVTAGGGKATLSRLIAERNVGETNADLFMAELNDVPRIAKYDLFLPVTSDDIPNLASVPANLLATGLSGFVPYEYGYITLTYDAQAFVTQSPPATLEDLADPAYAGELICEDPRTSSTGFSFLLWTIAHFGEDKYLDFWRSIHNSLLTITQGWSEAWSLLTHNEAPLMVSFSTDTAYAAMSGDPLRYRAYAPGGEGYRTVYGIGVVKGTHNAKLAKEFIDLLLSKQIQELIPKTEVMFPVNTNATLPQAFKRYAIVPQTVLSIPLDVVGKKMAQWLHAWETVIIQP